MADISKIKTIDGTEYTIKDSTARSSLSNYVAKAGDIMTGTLSVSNGHFRVRSDVVTHFIQTDNAAGTAMRVALSANYVNSVTVRETTPDTSYTENYMFPQPTTTDGNKYYSVYTQKNPPTASDVGAVPISGGTMTGNIAAPNIIIKGSASGVSPSIMGRSNSDSSLGTIDFFTTGQIQFRSYVIGVGSENYKLPVPTSAGTEYSILTSKVTGNEVSTAGTSVTVPNNTVKNIATITIPAGTWIIQFMAIFTSNSTGYRQIGLGANAVESHMTRYCKVIVGAASGADTQISSTTILAPSAQTTYYLNVVQTSGGNLSVIGGLDARRLV